ncbi:MAG: TIGR00282 family metallophosphoesterase [Pseudomonadota bacterium]
MKLLLLGDIVGRGGRRALTQALPSLVGGEEIDLVVANGENSAGGIGISPRTAEEMLRSGVDCITTGNHVWKKKDITDYLQAEPRIVRPANFPPGAPGRGSTLVETKGGCPVGIVNLQGRVFMEPIDCPFRVGLQEVERLQTVTKVIIVDFHAEATSEKIALGCFLDGKVSVVVGTHTHVQTADERVLPGGTAFITDLGMTGPTESIIGMKREGIIRRFLTGLPQSFDVAAKGVELQGVVVEVDADGKAVAIRRVRVACDP